MRIGKPVGHTRTIGVAQGYNGLHLADIPMVDGTPCMYSVWHPTPAELKALAGGGYITLGVIGVAHPPIDMYVCDRDGTAITDEGIS